MASLTSPSTACATIGALPSPSAMSTTRRAPRMVATPMVMARRGTLFFPKKSPAASVRVTLSSVIRRVTLCRPEPGSGRDCPGWR